MPDALQVEFEKLQRAHQSLCGKHDLLSSQLSLKKAEIGTLQSGLLVLKKTEVVLAKLAEERQKKVIDFISGIVTHGITTVFQKPLRFVIETVMRARDVNMNFYIDTPSGRTSVESHGGGLICVVSFLLQLLVFLMMVGKGERLFVFDEPFSHLSDCYHENVASLMKFLAEKLKVRFLLVTHEAVICEAADTLYEISSNGTVSTLTKVR